MVFLLTAAVYAFILIAVFISQKFPPVPLTDEPHYNLSAAYTDLQLITAKPHPYNSRFNDDVRQYILHKLKAIDGVEIADDLVSNKTWAGTYFEGTNILVRIQGTETSDEPGVLFSAHYDSVSTSYGAVDDGMGVVALIQLAKYFTVHKPRRTVVFNINNGEEDGLNGAHAFLQHPWSKLVNVFLNLEGAAGGGRPLLFRASSGLSSFKNVAAPHVNVLSGDVFNAGLVKSRTDFTVYEDGGMKGIDFAFYRGRSRYHTRLDKVSYIFGQEAALWNLMESTRSAGVALANADTNEDTKPSVYFDLFFSTMISFPQKSLFIANIALLLVTPVIFLFQRNHRHIINFKFPLAVFITIAAETLLVFLFQMTNPYIIYSSPALVLFASGTLGFLTLTSLPSPSIKTALLQTYVLLYLLLVVATVLLGKLSIGGFYFFTFWLSGVWIALLLELAPHPLPIDRPLPPIPHQAEAETEAADETTPLLRQSSNDNPSLTMQWLHWYRLFLPYIQLALTIPIPVTLILHLTYILTSLPETLADGGTPIGVYIIFSFIGFLLALPAVPFTAHAKGKRVIGTVWLLLTFYLVTTFPFGEQIPLKVYFQQTVDSTVSQTGAATTTLIGVPSYVPKLISYLPSARGKEVSCQRLSQGMGPTGIFKGLANCSWSSSELLPSRNPGWWDRFDIRRKKGETTVSLQFKPRGDTRNCRIHLDRPGLVTAYRVQPASEWTSIADTDTKDFKLWSRTWNRQWAVDFLLNSTSTLSGRVACQYAEAELVPAYQELLDYLPSWGIVTKTDAGLIDVSRDWKI